MGYYFNRYREIGDPKELPLKSKDAQKLFRDIWRNRDSIMHGHDVDLVEEQIVASRDAIKALSMLWHERPGAGDPLVVEGPFSGVPRPSNPDVWVRRAIARHRSGFPEDAKDAASHALSLDKDNPKIKGLVDYLNGV